MSSSSQSATTSYTCGIPGSQVTITLNKSGNHTLTLSRGPNPNSKTSSSVPVPQRKFPDGWVGPANMPFCKVCYDAGLPVADYNDHYVKDQPGPGGKVVCPTLLAQKCLKCGVAGHTSSYCPQEARLEAERKEREREAKRMNASDVKAWKVVGGAGAGAKLSAPPAAPPVPAGVVAPLARNSFGLLAVDSGDESEREREEVQTSVADTRFQLHHALCHHVEVSRRAPSAKKHAAATNHRGNAAEVARESSNKRKQESVTIPA